jgi:hypothetical protein
MPTIKSLILAAALGVPMLNLITPQKAQALPNAIFGRDTLYDLPASDISNIRNSGFSTVVLFVVDVHANGDLNYDSHADIVRNGAYIGDPGWPSRLAQLKQAPSSVVRIEMCTGGAGAQSWVNIKNLIAQQGTGSSSILYRNFQVLKNTLGIDAICNDDEVAFDGPSAAAFNRMITSLGMKNTLCPYNNVGYWQYLVQNSSIDRVYLQCYDGGAGNNPNTWAGWLGMPCDPGCWFNDSVSTVQSKMSGWGSGCKGGWMWQYEFIKGNLSAYAAAVYNGIGFRGDTWGRFTCRKSGLVLDVIGANTANGTLVEQWGWNKGNNQQWNPEFLSGNQYRIRGRQSGRVLDMAASTTANNANVEIWDWNGGNNQKFTFTNNGGNFYTPIFVHDGKALSVFGGSTSPGANVVQFDYNGGQNAQWEFGPL